MSNPYEAPSAHDCPERLPTQPPRRMVLVTRISWLAPLVSIGVMVLFSALESTVLSGLPRGPVDATLALAQVVLVTAILLVGAICGFCVIVAKLRHGYRGIVIAGTIGFCISGTMLVVLVWSVIAGILASL